MLVEKSFVVVALGAAVVLARAGDAGGVPNKVPTVTIPCAPMNSSLSAVDGMPVVCWEGACMKVELDGTGAELVATPPPVPPWRTVAAVTTDSVCMGTSCKKLGAKLRTAVADARKKATTEDPARIAATTDLAVVVINGDPWSVARDKKMALKRPSEYKNAEAAMVGATVAGDLLVADWADCAGPCTQSQIVDSRGKNRGGTTQGGGAVLELGARHFAVIGEYASVQIFDTHTGKARGSTPGTNNADAFSGAIRLEDDQLAVLVGEPNGYHVLIFDIDEHGEVTKPYDRYLPVCAP